jgi:two-component system, OmpR family, response regulator
LEKIKGTGHVPKVHADQKYIDGKDVTKEIQVEEQMFKTPHRKVPLQHPLSTTFKCTSLPVNRSQLALEFMRILVIEDDFLLCSSLVATLRDENFAVDFARDGGEGLIKARDEIYDAIILDVLMPILDGWQVLDRLRPQVKTPILMLTSLDTVPDRIKGLNKGADDYLVKPFDSDELLARLNALIRRTSGLTHPVIEIEKIRIDTALRTITVEGEIAFLTAREYSLVEYLALNRGTVISRARLYERLFDENDDTLSNLLDVHVSNIRKKLGNRLIQTRRGHGYVIP